MFCLTMLGRSPPLKAVLSLVCLEICQGCYVLQLYNDGLAANLNVLLHSLPGFYGVNGTIFLDDKLFQYRCHEHGGFFDIFEAGMLQPYTDTKEQRECLYYDYLMMREPATETGLVSYPGIFKQLWRLQPSFREHVDRALQELQGYEDPTIAFHVRGGDKFKEDEELDRKAIYPVDLVNTYLDNFPSIKGGTCLIFGDEQKLLLEMEHLVKRHIGCMVAHGSSYHHVEGHHQSQFNSQSIQAKCRATKGLIADLVVMSNADYFVGSSTSGMLNIVNNLRLGLYDKSLVSYARPDYDDPGSKLRRFWGMGGFHNVTIDTTRKLEIAAGLQDAE